MVTVAVVGSGLTLSWPCLLVAGLPSPSAPVSPFDSWWWWVVNLEPDPLPCPLPLACPPQLAAQRQAAAGRRHGSRGEEAGGGG